jgi:L-lactate dehydrogenase complex protein LldE
MKISLFIPCFVDAFFPQTGAHIVNILERLGHTVDYPMDLTCCGQPAFNSGYWDESRTVAKRVLQIFEKADVVVIASGSCGAMLKVFYPDLFKDTSLHQAALDLSAKTHEFSEFLVNELHVTDVGARFPAKVTFHDGCHGLRELNIKNEPRQLLEKVRDLELVEMQEAETCCGFGGTFAAKFPAISTAMGEVKSASAVETGADYIVSNDSSCLMHIQGLLDRQKKPIKTIHLAQILDSVEG